MSRHPADFAQSRRMTPEETSAKWCSFITHSASVSLRKQSLENRVAHPTREQERRPKDECDGLIVAQSLAPQFRELPQHYGQGSQPDQHAQSSSCRAHNEKCLVAGL